MQPRILLIEDDPQRIEFFRQWLAPTPYRLIEARSGGQALGLLRRGVEGIAGVCLDHDLGDEHASGTQVAVALQSCLPRQVPVLVHSMNTIRAPWMVSTLQAAGFSVTRIRFCILSAPLFNSWLADVTDLLEV